MYVQRVFSNSSLDVLPRFLFVFGRDPETGQHFLSGSVWKFLDRNSSAHFPRHDRFYFYKKRTAFQNILKIIFFLRSWRFRKFSIRMIDLWTFEHICPFVSKARQLVRIVNDFDFLEFFDALPCISEWATFICLLLFPVWNKFLPTIQIFSDKKATLWRGARTKWLRSDISLCVFWFDCRRR